MKIVLSW